MKDVDASVDVAALVGTGALLAAVAANWTGPIRLLLALAFVTFVPGWALLDHVRLVEGSSKVALSVAASLTICGIVTLGTLWLRAWRPFAVFNVIAFASVVGLVASIVRALKAEH